MKIILYAFSIAYFAALCFLLYFGRKNRKYYAPAKGLVSFLFVAVSPPAFLLGAQNSAFRFYILLLALVLCAAGDVMLGLANRTKKIQARPFMAGVVCFAAAHTVYCGLFYSMVPFYWFDVVLPLSLLLCLRLLEQGKQVRLKKMKAPAYIYTILVGLMAGKAVQIGFLQGTITLGGTLLAVGALLFLISDVILLFLYFGVHRVRWLRHANLATYYVGIYLIAMSARWF